jgi:hypothetical protein
MPNHAIPVWCPTPVDVCSSSGSSQRLLCSRPFSSLLVSKLCDTANLSPPVLARISRYRTLKPPDRLGTIRTPALAPTNVGFLLGTSSVRVCLRSHTPPHRDDILIPNENKHLIAAYLTSSSSIPVEVPLPLQTPDLLRTIEIPTLQLTNVGCSFGTPSTRLDSHTPSATTE